MTQEFFNETLEEVKKKSKKYNFITNAGISFKNALFEIFKYVWNNEKKPSSWGLDTLIQIHKRGSKEDLDSYRYIHLREDVPKLFSFMVTKLVKPKIVKNISKYQIGAMPGHRSQEHLFCMRSIISLYNERMKKPIIVSLLDVSKFFDRENLKDAMDSLYDSKVKGKLYKLVYMLNKDTEIQVKTGVGTTEKAKTDENVTQGSVDGAVTSSSSISKGVNDVF